MVCGLSALLQAGIIFNPRAKMNKAQYKALKRYSLLLIIFCAILSILKGIRFPNIWSVSHYYFTYSHGVVKRAFLGSVFDFILSDSYYNYSIVFVIMFLIYAASIVAFLTICFKSIAKDKYFIFPMLAFILSPAFVYYHHIIGYFDQIGFLLLCIIIAFLNKFSNIGSLIYCFISLVVLGFIHEGQLILWGPLFFIILYAKLSDYGFGIKPLILSASICLLSLLIIATTFSFFNQGILLLPEALSMYREVSKKVDFKLRADAFIVLTRTGGDNYLIMQSRFKNPAVMDFIKRSFIINLPLFILFASYVRQYLIKILPEQRNTLSFVFLGSASSPLMLHFFGLDHHRWNSLWVINSFILLLILLKKENLKLPLPSPRMLILIAVVIILGLSSDNYFFDGYYPKQFPFEAHYKYLINLFHGKDTFPFIPSM